MIIDRNRTLPRVTPSQSPFDLCLSVKLSKCEHYCSLPLQPRNEHKFKHILNANLRDHETTLGFRVGVNANSGYFDHNGPYSMQKMYTYNHVSINTIKWLALALSGLHCIYTPRCLATSASRPQEKLSSLKIDEPVFRSASTIRDTSSSLRQETQTDRHTNTQRTGRHYPYPL